MDSISFMVLFLSMLSAVSGQSRNKTRFGGRRRAARHDVLEGSLRLVGGRASHEGNVEIFHAGLWGSVCDDEWDNREAEIVCKILGHANATEATHNSEFGRGRRKIWMDNLYCSGVEDRLEKCRFDGWGMHDCGPNEAAGVRCETTTANKTTANTEPSPLKQGVLAVRVLGGRHSSEGRVEVRGEGEKEWGLVCGDGFGLLEANVVCQQLGMGYGQAAVQSSYFGGSHEQIVLSGLRCTGREANLSDCRFASYGKRAVCPGTENIAGVMCAFELPDLVPDEAEVERSVYLEDRQLLMLQCAMEENCLSSEAYKVEKNGYDWMYEQRRLLRFTARIGNIGTTDFRPFLPKHTWQWHMCHMHYHSMEVFAHFDIMDSTGRKVAEGHKASFCLEDNNCLPGVEKKYACANYGDQGISVGCTDTYLSNIDCQWVDITELQPGIYTFKVSINPEFKVAELNYDNNAAVCTLYYNAVSARLLNCTLQRP